MRMAARKNNDLLNGSQLMRIEKGLGLGLSEGAQCQIETVTVVMD